MTTMDEILDMYRSGIITWAECTDMLHETYCALIQVHTEA